jgi:hypothetical protein
MNGAQLVLPQRTSLRLLTGPPATTLSPPRRLAQRPLIAKDAMNGAQLLLAQRTSLWPLAGAPAPRGLKCEDPMTESRALPGLPPRRAGSAAAEETWGTRSWWLEKSLRDLGHLPRPKIAADPSTRRRGDSLRMTDMIGGCGDGTAEAVPCYKASSHPSRKESPRRHATRVGHPFPMTETSSYQARRVGRNSAKRSS